MRSKYQARVERIPAFHAGSIKMDKDKKFEILMRKLAQCINLANELQVNISWPIKVAARSVMKNNGL